MIVTVERISEAFMLPAIQPILAVFTFKILRFHADNGGEYINDTIAALLDKLFIEFTKSRPRHSNDNALVESKNGSMVRKLYGYEHIPEHRASQFNAFNQTQVYRYVNFHRPCYFPTTVIDNKGKEKKACSDMMTPHYKFISLTSPKQYLKLGITLEQLNAFSKKMNNNEAAEQLNTARDTFFKQ